MQSAFYCKRDETILYLNFQFKVLGNVVEDGKTDAKWQHVLFPSEMPQRAYDSMEPFKGDCQGDIDRANTKSVQKAINKYHDMPATRKLHHLIYIRVKITEKVAFNIASEASYVYSLSRQQLIGPFWRDLKT